MEVHQKCEDIIRLPGEVAEIKADVKAIWGKIEEIRDKLLQRPSWAVCSVISILCIITTASLTFAFVVLRR